MVTNRKIVELTDQQYEWAAAQVEAGLFASVNDCISELVQREQERIAELEYIRAALIEGEESGVARDFDVEEFKQRMLKEHG